MTTIRNRPSLLALVAAGLALGLPGLASAQAQHSKLPKITPPPKNAAPQRAAEAPQVDLTPLPTDGTLASLEDLVSERAIEFTLTDTEGNEHTLSDELNGGQIVVLEWFNPTCPFVVAHYDKATTMNDLVTKYGEENVVWLAINSGGDSTGDARLNEAARDKWDMAHPVLLDPTGAVGKAYGAKNTPSMIVITPDGTIAYGGGIDNRKSSTPINYVETAVDALLVGSTVETEFAKPYGCSVKYKRK